MYNPRTTIQQKAKLVFAFFVGCLLPASQSFAQEEDFEIEKTPAVTLNGSIQSDFMIAPQTDAAIGAYDDSYDNSSFLNNTFVDLQLQSKWIDAGGRFELKQWPMPGFDDQYNDFKGWGVPNLWAKFKTNVVDVTLGTFYEQFGSGFILRAYEERSLGVDNSILGARVAVRPFSGAQIKAICGKQRAYWDWDTGLITGADAELSLDELITKWSENDTHLTIGGSWINKREDPDETIMADVTHKLNLPKYVNAFDARVRFQKSDFSVLAEYAQKSADPNSLNNYIYSRGNAAMLSASYSHSGISLLAQVKRSENMGFRNKRSAPTLCTAYYINHLPAFTLDHTYALAALYPYVTNTEGEWGYQGAIGYNFKRRSTLGGKYGTKLKLNYSLVRGLEHNNLKGDPGTDGYKNCFFKNGDTYYQDLNLQIDKRFTKQFEGHFMYMYQQFNKTVLRGEGGNIYSNIFIGDGKWTINDRFTLRAEAQYLMTEHESGDWGCGLIELSVAPYLMFSVSDQIGRTEPENGVYGEKAHYYNAAVTFDYKAHRIMIGYGRTRAGYNCTGGVCRFVPASKGVTINYNYNF
ncbi:MAG: DUF6029 family protein [Prevotellaceae bacterium]|nr:DUF6029 family protein [Prevotellaceae bacterium]